MDYQEKTECLANTETRRILTTQKIFSTDLKRRLKTRQETEKSKSSLVVQTWEKEVTSPCGKSTKPHLDPSCLPPLQGEKTLKKLGKGSKSCFPQAAGEGPRQLRKVNKTKTITPLPLKKGKVAEKEPPL